MLECIFFFFPINKSIIDENKGNDELETSDIPVIIEKNRNNCSTETESKESGIEMFDVPMHNSECSKYFHLFHVLKIGINALTHLANLE